jgi:hypothetical protein
LQAGYLLAFLSVVILVVGNFPGNIFVVDLIAPYGPVLYSDLTADNSFSNLQALS